MADKKISQLTGATTPLAGTEVVPLVQSGVTKKVAVSDLTTGRAVSGLSFATANVTVGASAVTAGTDISYSVNSGATQTVSAAYTTGSFRPALKMSSVGANHDMILQFTDLCRFYNAAGDTQFAIDHLNGKVTTEYNIALAAGKGIDFSADGQAAGMTSELLDDYEEGTWTPVDGSVAGLTFTTAVGHYTKVGNVVTCGFAVVYPSTASTAGGLIAGLPFAAKSTSPSLFGGYVTYTDSSLEFDFLVGSGGSQFNIYLPTGGSVGNNQLSTFALRGVVTYLV